MTSPRMTSPQRTLDLLEGCLPLSDTPSPSNTVSVRAFLDQVAGVLQSGLPARQWIEATVISVRVGQYGHTLELVDASTARGAPATLRAFLSGNDLARIRQDLGLALDPALLVGMTTALLVAPGFSARWHLGGRVEALTRAAGASLRERVIAQAAATLKREGLWERQRALPRPRDITTISVVHPSGAAGWADIAGELGRWQGAGLIRLRCSEAPFEGERAARVLVAALTAASEPVEGHRPDLILIVRGGGARSSLAVLDDEAMARAVCRCPVPVLVGTGHAVDRTLVDQVAWRAVDTPSKAIGFVAGVIVSAARSAEGEWAGLLAIARAAVLSHERQLDARSEQLRAAAQRTTAGADADLAACWSRVLVAATAARERCGLWQAEAMRHLADVLARAPQVVAAYDGALQQLIRVGLGRASALVARHDGGATLLAQVEARASALLEREVDVLEQRLGTVLQQAGRELDHASSALVRLEGAIEASDLDALLRRGLVVVTDAAGRLLPTRAAAVGHLELSLVFADGLLTVRAVEDAAPIRPRSATG